MLEWPSLTVDWFPEKEYLADCDYAVHSFAIGTQTAGREPEAILLGNVKLPHEAGIREEEPGSETRQGDAGNRMEIDEERGYGGAEEDGL